MQKKTRFNGYVYGFSVDYDAIAIGDILDTELFNEKEWHSIIKYLGFLKSAFLQD